MVRLRSVALGLTLLLAASCATGSSVSHAQDAADRGDWDTAVAYYRQALAKDPEDVELRVGLERASRRASADHLERARQLEAQDQMAGAIAEYKQAADLDRGNTMAVTKAFELERRMREQIEAARPPSQLQQLQQQAAQQSGVPRLDPRVRVPQVNYQNTAIRDILTNIGQLTGINITYDRDAQTSNAYTIQVQDIPVEDALNQVLSANQLTFKVINPTTIFVYNDTPNKRQQWDDVYTQTFYVSHADVNEVLQLINQMITTGAVVRPAIAQNKGLNSIVVKATLPVLEAIDAIIKANDKPRAEVLVEAEILEVDKIRMRQLGIDLSQYALGVIFSPEVAPPNVGTIPNNFPTQPPPFNLNTISGGVSRNDFYVSPMTALIRFLESDSTTKTLASTQLRGREGAAMSLRLGDLIPIPTTVFNSAAAGGVNNIPTTQVNYQAVGVNLLFTPRVTFEDEIIIDQLTLEKSALGNNILVGGQIFPTIVTRNAQSSMRLRDGEPNLLAGLLREDERKTLRSYPGIAQIPILRDLLGATDKQIEQTDIVMIITPRIIRGHDLKTGDLRPTYVGTAQNFGLGRVPSLISPDAPPPQATVPVGGGAPTIGAPGAPGAPVTNPQGAATPPAQTTPPPPPAQTGQARAPGIVPIQAVGGETPPTTPPAGQAQMTLTVGGEQQAGGPAFTVPISLANVSSLGSITVTVTFDPAIVQIVGVSPGTFMAQGGVDPTFVPKMDPQSGRVDIAIARPGGSAASGNGLVAAIQFRPVAAGTATLTPTVVGISSTGQPVTIRTTPATVVVK